MQDVLFPCKPGKFVIISTPRTGSNLLRTLLDSHPEIVCHSELFSKDAIYYSYQYGHEWISGYTKAKRDSDPVQFLNFIYGTKLKETCHAIGFKILNEQNDTVLNQLIKDKTIKKIILKRENALMSYLSFLELQKTGKALAKDNNDIYKTGDSLKITVDFHEFDNYKKQIDLFYSKIISILNETSQGFFLIKYTDLLNRRKITEILSFINVESTNQQIFSNLQKQNQRDLCERIANYSEFVNELKKGGYENLLQKEL